MTELNQYLDKAFEFEEKGYVEEAIQLCNKCIEAFPEFRNEIFLEIAKMQYRNGKKKEALLQFLALYQETGDREIRDMALGVYYGVKKEEYAGRYQENYRRLNDYPYFFGSKKPKEIRYYPVFVDEEWICYYDEEEKNFQFINHEKIILKEAQDVICISNDLLWMEDILLLEKMTRDTNSFMDSENALLLVYRRDTWELLLQLLDLDRLIEFDRILLFDSREQLGVSLREGGVYFPSLIVSGCSDELSEIVDKSFQKVSEEYRSYRRQALEYYGNNGEEIIRRIKAKKMKILFWTSRFTTALQYHIRDCKIAAENMGMETDLIIEKNRLRMGFTHLYIMKKIALFKPDIVFMIDHFRHEHNIMKGLENLVWICWAQDPLEEVMNMETPLKLISRDFVLNHFITGKKFKSVGYGKKHLIDAPVPANSYIYKPYQLSDEEKNKYFCDICVVCHGSDVDAHIENVVQALPENLKEPVHRIYKGYQRYVYETGDLFYTENLFAAYMDGAFRQHYGIALQNSVLALLAEDMYMQFNQRVYRQALVDWMIDAGFSNIKLWGNGWATEEKYKEYAMGAAENGEILSKIYQASKIVIGNNIGTTAAARVWETMLSGGFYMSNYIPEEEDAVDIRKIIEVDRDVIMFYNREDLIEKLHFYLEHEEERQKMIERGRKAALENMTYDIMMERVLEEVAERL